MQMLNINLSNLIISFDSGNACISIILLDFSVDVILIVLKLFHHVRNQQSPA